MKNIIFDVGGVLLKGTPESSLDALDIEEKEALSPFFQNWEKIDLGEETLEEKYQSCHFPKEVEKWKEFLVHYYEKREINKELISLIKELKKRYKIYILSDNNQETYEYYKKHKDFKNIDGWIVSCEYHTMKQDKELFKILLEKFHLNPKECFFIDNNPKNIAIAEEFGIKGYPYQEDKDIDYLYENLRKNGIL